MDLSYPADLFALQRASRHFYIPIADKGFVAKGSGPGQYWQPRNQLADPRFGQLIQSQGHEVFSHFVHVIKSALPIHGIKVLSLTSNDHYRHSTSIR
jgi:hypothetical protein